MTTGQVLKVKLTHWLLRKQMTGGMWMKTGLSGGLRSQKTSPKSKHRKKDRHTKEVEAESVAYTVCQRYGIETSDYSFGYIAGWSSDKETKELKGSLETIRKSAAEMIEGIDEKLKVLLAEKEAEVECEAEYPPRDEGIPVYRQTASYALEADELDIYHASYDANVACKEAIEYAISSHYADNRLAARSCGHKCFGAVLPGTGSVCACQHRPAESP